MPTLAMLVMPLAAGIDWLEGLLPLLFLVIWIVSQVRALFRGAARPPVLQVPPRPPQADPEAAADIERQIEAFLRRKMRRGPEPGPIAAAPAKPSRRRGRRTAAGGGPPPVPRSVRPGAADAQDVAGHVANAFAHDLAHQVPDDTADAASVPTAPTAAEELATALRRPGGLRQVVLLHEVLTRPTHRW